MPDRVASVAPVAEASPLETGGIRRARARRRGASAGPRLNALSHRARNYASVRLGIPELVYLFVPIAVLCRYLSLQGI